MSPERSRLWREAVFAVLLEVRLLSQHNHQYHECLEIIQALSDWSHNIALFSTDNFEEFNEPHALEEAKQLVSPHLVKLRGNLTIVLRQLGLEF